MPARTTKTSSSITEKDLESLRPEALAALAERIVWRCAPVLVNELSDGDTLRQMMMGGLCLVSARAGREQLAPLVERYLVDLRNSGSGGESASGPGLAYISQAGLVANDSERYRGYLKMLMEPLEDRAEQICIQDDFMWLSSWQQEKRSADGIVGPDFFERALWAGLEGDQPPSVWQEWIERWHGWLSTLAFERFPELYRQMIAGGGFAWDWLDEWLKDALVRESTTTDTSDTEETSTSEETLEGGIVTAAADKPAEVDHLGRKPLVNTLADMLASKEQALPMTIALLGDWGAGKSSVLEQLKRKLEVLKQREFCAKYLFAEFNAWEYEQTDNLRAGLAQEVVRGLVGGLNRFQQVRLALRNAARNHGMSFYLSVSWLLLVALGALLGVANLDKLSDLNPITQSVIGTGGVAVVLFTLARTGQQLLKLLEHPLAEKLSTYLRLPSYGKHLGLVPVIRKEIASLCEERLSMKDADRLLVIVDDLDRCHPKAITETLDAIRLVMNLDQVAVIIAIDDRIAFRAVAEHYKDLAEPGVRSKEAIARDYLSKIIQLPVNLYAPWPNEVEEFAREALFGLTTEAEKQALSVDAGSGATGAGTSQTQAAGTDAASPAAAAPAGSPATAGAVAEPPANAVVVQTDPAAAASSSESEDTGNGLLSDTPFERDLFIELAREFGYHNPRQLIRLRNSFRWLKGYRHSSRPEQVTHSLVRELMLGLFWYEYLYQRKLRERQFAELTVWLWPENLVELEKEAQERDDRKETHPIPVRAARRFHQLFTGREYADEYFRLMKTVELVVLPNAEMGLIESLARAKRLLFEFGNGDVGAFSPWVRPPAEKAG